MNLKKSVLVAVMLVTGLGTAQASELATENSEMAVEQSMSDEAAQASEFDLENATTYNVDDRVVGGIIVGAIVGAIAADRLEIQYPHHRHPNRQFACYAENRNGRIFMARGQHPNRVQDRALNKCYTDSRWCRPRGCQWIGRAPVRHQRPDRFRTFPVRR